MSFKPLSFFILVNHIMCRNKKDMHQIKKIKYKKYIIKVNRRKKIYLKKKRVHPSSVSGW